MAEHKVKQRVEWEGGGRKRHRNKGGKGSEKAKRERERRFLKAKGLWSKARMSSDEDVPAPSPLASVVARRASREAKSMREESNTER
jgi:hypothetical protein